MLLAFSLSIADTAISTAPPPATSRESNTTLRATLSASCRFRSTSFSTSLDAPRSTIVQALASLHSAITV
jgi:hypothetical protein